MALCGLAQKLGTWSEWSGAKKSDCFFIGRGPSTGGSMSKLADSQELSGRFGVGACKEYGKNETLALDVRTMDLRV